MALWRVTKLIGLELSLSWPSRGRQPAPVSAIPSIPGSREREHKYWLCPETFDVELHHRRWLNEVHLNRL